MGTYDDEAPLTQDENQLVEQQLFPSLGNFSVSLEDEIALNESMLQSLHERMMELDAQILEEQRKILEHENNIISIVEKQGLYRKTRDTNSALLREVTQSMDRCIQALKKKRSENPDRSNAAVNLCDGNTNIEMIEEETENNNAEGVLDTSVSNFTNDNIGENNTENSDHLGSDRQEEEASTDKIEVENNEFYKPIPLQDLKDIKFLEDRWSQLQQSKITIFRKSEAISEPIYPLFAPHSSPELLRKIMIISQKENLMRREGMDADELKNDYNKSIKGTVLDIFTCAQYDPHMVRGREVAMGNSKHRDQSKEVESPEKKPDIHKSDSQPESEVVPSKISTASSSNIDANVIICRKALFGKCSDPSCDYQHLSGRANVKTRYKNKLRTVTTTKRAIHIELPIRNHPLPPAPSLRKDVLSVDCNKKEEDEGNSEDTEPEWLARKRDQPEGDEECTSEDMEQERHARKRNPPEEDSSDLHLESSKRIKGLDHASAIDHNSTIGVNCDKKVNTIENEVEVKNDMLESTTFGEDDFISLPTIEDESSYSDSENNSSVFHISSALRMVLSDCDKDENNGHDSGDESKDSLPDIDAGENVDNNLSSFSEALRCFGFLVDDSKMHAKNEKPNATFITPNCLLEGYSATGKKCPFFESSTLMKSIVNSLRLSIHAGRVDVSSAIVGHCSYALIPEEAKNKCNGGLEIHNRFITRLTKDLQTVATGSSCGRGSLSPFSLFTVQLYLANCSSYIEAYISENNLPVDEATKRVKMKCLASFLCKHPYKTLEHVLSHKEDSCENNAEKVTVLQVEKDLEILTRSFVENPSSVGRLLLSLSFGQKLSRLFGISLCSSGQDPQLSLETFLFSILSLMKSFSKQWSRIISSEREKDILHSSQTKLQLVIFNTFGPAIFTIISGIVQSMGCYHQETSSWDVTTGLDSRNVGICVQVRQLLMEAIQELDFSGVASESSYDGQLLLCPFFCVLSSLLVVGGSAQKSHVLLVNALHTAHSKNNWSLYSDLLWSSLIQLHIVYPDKSIITASPQHKLELAQRPLDYGVNPSLVMLEGDSALVQCLVELQHPPQIKGWKKRIKLNEEMICQLSSACAQLSSVKLNSADFVLNLKIGRGSFAIKRLPMSLCLTAIMFRNVVFNACRLEDLPASFGHHFCFLKSLDLSNNSLKELPESFSKLSNLYTLTLDNNKFEVVPEVIENLPKLERFSATNNRIKEMGVILNCTNLTSINLSHNIIGGVPVDLPLRLPKLATLHLRGNPFGKETA